MSDFKVNIGGVEYALSFEMSAWRAAERKLKQALWPILGTPIWLEATRLEVNALVLFIGLQKAKPDITVEWIDNTMTWEEADKANAVATEAIDAFFLRRVGRTLTSILSPDANQSVPSGTTDTSIVSTGTTASILAA